MAPNVAVVLPLSVITTMDLSRVLRELSLLDEFLLQSSIRTPGTPMTLPRLSRLLDETATVNKMNLLEQQDRTVLIAALTSIKERAPRLHISLTAEPSAQFINKISEYIRANISSTALIQIGLQPTIAAGCIFRTPNRQFDFSLRQHLRECRPKLSELIHQTQVVNPVARPLVAGEQLPQSGRASAQVATNTAATSNTTPAPKRQTIEVAQL